MAAAERVGRLGALDGQQKDSVDLLESLVGLLSSVVDARSQHPNPGGTSHSDSP